MNLDRTASIILPPVLSLAESISPPKELPVIFLANVLRLASIFCFRIPMAISVFVRARKSSDIAAIWAFATVLRSSKSIFPRIRSAVPVRF